MQNKGTYVQKHAHQFFAVPFLRMWNLLSPSWVESDLVAHLQQMEHGWSDGVLLLKTVLFNFKILLK